MSSTFARPTSDVTPGPWLTQTDAPDMLWAQVDETPHSETDFVYVSFAGPAGIPDQVGNVVTYTTQNGTACTQRGVHAGGVADDYHYALLFLPNTMDRHASAVVVCYFHGATANELQVVQNTDGTGANGMLDSWLDLGYAVMSFRLGTTGVIDAATDNNDGKWGNAPLRAALADAYPWIGQVFTLHPHGLLFYGFSAGGTNATNALIEAAAHGQAVAAVVLVDPAMNLRSMFGGDTASGGIHGQIQAAYSLPNNTKVRSKAVSSATSATLTDTTASNWTPNSLDGGEVRILFGTGAGQARTVASHTSTTLTVSSPWAVTPDTSSWYTVADVGWIAAVDTDGGGHDPLIAAGIPDVPFYLSASPSDTTCHKPRNADAFVARLTAAGYTSELVLQSYSGSHGLASHFAPIPTNAFYSRALA